MYFFFKYPPPTVFDCNGLTLALQDGRPVSYNHARAEPRAQAVSHFLPTHGVQSARIATRGFGETQPIASNATAEGKASSRRVEIKIAPVTEQDVRSCGASSRCPVSAGASAYQATRCFTPLAWAHSRRRRSTASP